jgi:hypothetical protein
MADQADITRLLLSYGSEIKLGKRSCLISTLELRNVNKLRVLLEAGADPNTDHLLYKVARPNDQHEYEDDIWRVQSQREIISLLLKHGANPFACCGDGSSVLQNIIEEHGILDPL